MIIPPDVPDHGDISDYPKTHSREELEQLIEQSTDVTEKNVAQTVKPKQSLANKLIELKAVERFAMNDNTGFVQRLRAILKNPVPSCGFRRISGSK